MSSKPSTRRALSAMNSPPLSVIDTALALQQPNPFDLPPDNELFALRDREAAAQKQEHEEFIKRSLADRTISCLPNLRSQSRHLRSVGDNSDEVAPLIAEHQPRQQMSEFVDQKREIFHVQLLIDRKNKEIHRIQNMRKTEKKNIVEEYAKIAETSNQYKMTTNQYEAELTRGKKAMDNAIRRRTELQKELKKKSAFVAVLESEISRNEETLYSYRTYSDFMKKLTPPDRKMLDYFNEPEVLLEELEKVEDENLFLIRHCQELTYAQDAGLKAVQGEIDQTEAESTDVQEAMSKLKQVDEITLGNTGAVARECDDLDAQRRRLANMVTKTYKHCFGESADVNTLTRLERLENELEKMYRQSATIDPAFIAAKQAEKDKVRRDIQRKEKAEQHEREQKRRLDQVIARARMPIKRRTGRPLFERKLPIKVARNQVDRKKKLEEELILEQFLYGPIAD